MVTWCNERIIGPRCVTILLAVCAIGISVSATPAATTKSAARNAQALLVINQRILARAEPAPGSSIVGMVERRTPLTHVQTVLPIIETARGPTGGRWVRVRLPMRPNGVSGWVPAYNGKTAKSAWRIVVRRSARTATVFHGAKARAAFSVVVGRPSTPTPLGTFFIVEKIYVGLRVTDGPWALATSAYSNVLHRFAGGPGQIALHGVAGLSAPLGTFSSNGCVRFGNDAITWIATHVDNGTPVLVAA